MGRQEYTRLCKKWLALKLFDKTEAWIIHLYVAQPTSIDWYIVLDVR